MTIRAYIVGGAVRDRLLAESGYPGSSHDRDWVVVGATPEEMLAAGFEPVGADFPVFLHPVTHEEYALARTERKSAPGYHGFVFHAAADVTLEEDLRRRDLTVNAMAMLEDGTIVDPYGGRQDLQRHIFRHVSPAFAEDPVRILRVARFAARFPDFSIAPETMELMASMVAAGEADALVPERVMAEFAKGLMAGTPSRMVRVLAECGALARICPELSCGEWTGPALDRAAGAALPLQARFAVLALAAGPRAQAMAKRLRASSDAIGLAALLAGLVADLRKASGAAARVRVMHAGDAWRRPERFRLLLAAWQAVDGVELAAWLEDLEAACAVDAGTVARSCSDRREIPQAVLEARIGAALRRGGQPA